MGYAIQEIGGKFEVVEQDFKPLVMDRYDTLKEAEHAVKQWEARDKLQDIITDFIDEQIDNFSTTLDESEIMAMIKESAKDG